MKKDTNQEILGGRLVRKTPRTLGGLVECFGTAWCTVLQRGERSLQNMARTLLLSFYGWASRRLISLQGNSRITPVYDLVNAGPNHRFATANAIVANCTLGLGFGMGPAKFALTCAKMQTELPCFTRDRWDLSKRHLIAIRTNYKINPKEITCEKDEIAVGTYFGAASIVDQWRGANKEVVALWQNLQGQLESAARKNSPTHTFTLPSGRKKTYFNPRFVTEARKTVDPDTGEETTRLEKRLQASVIEGRMPVGLHGGPLTENIDQAIARDIMYWGAMDVVDATGWDFLWNAYDEVIFEVPTEDGERALALIPEKLCRGSSAEWTEGLPLEVEGGLFDHYTK